MNKKGEKIKINRKEVEEEQICSVEAAINEIGGKWKPLILYSLKEGKQRFNEINKKLPAITQRMLTKTLRELESDEIIHRKIYAEVPPKVEYCLTKKGDSVMPILDALCQWGKDYCEYEDDTED